MLQLTASPWTTEASTRERWQFGALTNSTATSSNRSPSLSSLYYNEVALSFRDKWITMIRLWWLSQWLVTHGHHLAVTIYLYVTPSTSCHSSIFYRSAELRKNTCFTPQYALLSQGLGCRIYFFKRRQTSAKKGQKQPTKFLKKANNSSQNGQKRAKPFTWQSQIFWKISLLTTQIHIKIHLDLVHSVPPQKPMKSKLVLTFRQ